ncbi:hypothetical protein BH24ACI5_BH24ACI5_16930 [soil metagenome]
MNGPTTGDWAIGETLGRYTLLERIGAVHASLGDVDEAYRWLDIAVQEKASGLILLRVHPRLDPIRADPRYWPLVRRVGLDGGL